MKNIGIWTAAALLIAVALPGTAVAQFSPSFALQKDDKVDPATQEKRDEIDRAYRNSKSSMPGAQVGVDPWANMRGTEEAKPARPAAKSANAQKKKAATPQ